MNLKLTFLSFFILLSAFAFSQKENHKQDNNKEEIIKPAIIVEVMPEFPGGTDALIKFLKINTQYPEEAKKNNIKGTLPIQIVVEADGSITHIKVLRGLGYGCDEEALRVVNLMPIWKPGKHNGRPVTVYFKLPINFGIPYKESQVTEPKKSKHKRNK